MKFNVCKDNKGDIWNEFVIKNDGSFLQSFEWGEFQKQFSKKVWRAEIIKNKKKIFEAQIIKEKISPLAPFPYLYIPYGPVFARDSSFQDKEEVFGLFLREIEKLSIKRKILFLRIESVISLPKIKNFYFQRSIKRIQPQRTLILDLEKSEKELLSNMHIRTRYNINLAERKGVKISISDNYNNIFYYLLRKTRKRQSFIIYPEEHYKKMFKINSKDFKVKMALAGYRDKIITAGIFVFFGDRATSLHAGSDYKYRALKGMNLLHWHAICTAKEEGYKIYDFWGINEKKYPGVTNFKKGFRGKEIEYPSGIDIIFNKTGYQIYRIMTGIKKIF